MAAFCFGIILGSATFFQSVFCLAVGFGPTSCKVFMALRMGELVRRQVLVAGQWSQYSQHQAQQPS
jgi:hypothetical protein